MKALVCLLVAATPAFADPDLVATARVGVSKFLLENPIADNDEIEGSGPTFAAQLGLRFERLGLEPAIAVEISQFISPDDEPFQPPRDIRERLVSVTARLRYSITDFFDVTGGLGGAVTFEHEAASDHYYGYRYELAAGFRLWHGKGQALRIEGSLSNTHLDVTVMNGVDFSIIQAGFSLAYSVRL